LETPTPEDWTLELNEPVPTAVPVGAARREAHAAPIAKESRIDDMDIIRGMALFGVLTMNLALGFRVPFFGNPFSMPTGLLERVVFRLELILLSGKAMSLFSILFGAGLAIFLERARARGPGALGLLARRLLFLTGFGLAHALLVWHGDILTSYSLTGLIALFFLQRRVSVVLIAAGGSLVWQALGPLWPAAAALAGREVPGHFQEAVRVYGTASYFDVVAFRAYEIFRLEMPGYIFLVPDELTKMLLGIAIWRSGILRLEVREKHLRALRWVGFAGILYGMGYSLYRWIYFEIYHPPRVPPGMLGRIFSNFQIMALACALGYGALLLLLLRRATWRKSLGIFAPLGRMAFTNYLTQSIVFSTLFYGYGFGLLGKFGYVAMALIGTAFYVLQGFVSTIWLRHFRFGPFEWAWRSLTYGQLQPMRR